MRRRFLVAVAALLVPSFGNAQSPSQQGSGKDVVQFHIPIDNVKYVFGVAPPVAYLKLGNGLNDRVDSLPAGAEFPRSISFEETDRIVLVDIRGTRKRCLGMVRKLLTDARETSYVIFSSLLTAECCTVQLPGNG